jgi:Peptidase MA superfamily
MSKTCPKCGSEKIADGTCLDCGIIVDKYIAMQKRAEQGLQKPAAPPAEEETLTRVPSPKKFFIFLGVTLIVGILLIKGLAGWLKGEEDREKPILFADLPLDSGNAFAHKLLKVGATGWEPEIVEEETEVNYASFRLPKSLTSPAPVTVAATNRYQPPLITAQAGAAHPDADPVITVSPSEGGPSVFEIEGGSITIEPGPTPTTNPVVNSRVGQFDGQGGSTLQPADFFRISWIGQKIIAHEWSGETLLKKAAISINTSLGLVPTQTIPVIFDGSASFAGMFFPPERPVEPDSSIRIPLATLNVDQNMFVEYIKREMIISMMTGLATRPPAWLMEGVGQYISRDTRYLEQMLSAGLTAEQFIPIYDITANHDKFAGEQAFIAYGESLSLVNTLVNTYGTFSLQELLLKLQGGIDFNTAFKETFYLELDEFTSRWWQRLTGY